jgi:hypothetical protein
MKNSLQKTHLLRVAIILLFVATLIHPFILYLSIERYNAWKQAELKKYPSDMASVIDFSPYTGTFEGGLLISIAAILGIFWLMLISHRKKLKSATLTVLMIIVALSFTPRVYAGYYEKIVDVLGVGDEEFDAFYPPGWERYYGWEIYVYAAFNRFEESFNINFKLRGWISWDSDDSTEDMYDLLQEAIQETGFVSGETTYNGYIIDVLMVFTGQLVYMQGFSPPEWKALIIKGWAPDWPRGRLIQHELSHQFWVTHCNNDCVMNPNLIIIPDSWCSKCAAIIHDNKDRFWRWIEGGGGGCWPPPRFELY